jgi:hypothetical protein
LWAGDGQRRGTLHWVDPFQSKVSNQIHQGRGGGLVMRARLMNHESDEVVEREEAVVLAHGLGSPVLVTPERFLIAM